MEGAALATITVENTRVESNSAYLGGGAVLLGNVEATCTGNEADEIGFVANVADVGAGVFVDGGDYAALFASATCDFGVEDSGADNLSGDVTVAAPDGNTPYRFGDDATFACAGSVCE